jgi:glycosyltransferase involved in cell wall biosynthesis
MNESDITDSARPLFTVITPSFNSAGDVAHLAESLRTQSFTDFEWVVQDGGSSDTTVQIVEASKVPNVHCESEKDAGISDAYNRAVRRAKGDFFLFLGADDRLADKDVLARLAGHLDELRARPTAVLAGAQLGDVRVFRSRISKATKVINTVHHQGAIYAREIFDTFRFREDIPVMADYGLTLALLGEGTQLSSSDIVITICGVDGVSNSTSEVRNYWDMHKVRSDTMSKIESLVYLSVGLVNVARRKMFHR